MTERASEKVTREAYEKELLTTLSKIHPKGNFIKLTSFDRFQKLFFQLNRKKSWKISNLQKFDKQI